MIKVYMADDHKIVTDGLTLLLKEDKQIKLLGVGKNGQEAVDFVAKNKVDVAVLDIDMPVMTGIEATEKIRVKSPDTRIVIMSMHNNADYIGQLTKLGCSGYILKNKGREELIDCIKTVYAGESYFGRAVVDTMINSMVDNTSDKNSVIARKAELTAREIEILILISEEYTTPEIAKKLFIASSTVDVHRRNLISKLAVKNSLGLVRYAIENKIFDN